MKNSLRFIFVLVVLSYSLYSCDSQTNTAPKIKDQLATPAQVAVNSTTDIVFSAKITDAQGKIDITGVVIDLTSMGGIATQTMVDDGTGGDVAALDSIFTYVMVGYTAPATSQNYLLEITATDSKNKSTFKEIAFAVIEPPKINSFTVSADPVDPGTTVTFNANIQPGTNPVGNVEIDLSSIGGNSAEPMIDNGGGAYSVDWTIPNSGAAGISPGDYTITLTAFDNATPANQNTAQITDFTVNHIVPGISSWKPEHSKLSTAVLFELEISTPNGLSSINQVLVDFSPISLLGPQQMFDDGTNGDVTADDGTFTYEFQTTDWKANLTTTTGYYELIVTISETSGTITRTFVPLLVFTQSEVFVNDATGNDTTGDGSQNNPYKTIGIGVDKSVDGSIVLIEDGIYMGANNRDIRFNNKRIIVKSLNGPTQAKIDCGGANHRGIEIVDDEGFDTIVWGLTIENGYVNANLGFGDDGGGIYIFEACPQIINCIFKDNTTNGNGGGIYVVGVQSTILKGPKILRCVVERNTTSGGNGGGIYVYQSVEAVIENCVVKNNTATKNNANVNGGGIYCYQSTAIISNTVVQSNTVRNTSTSTSHSARGGGIYLNRASSNPGTYKVNNCLITDNLTQAAGRFSQGAGIYLYSSGTNPEISNCTIADNEAEVTGSNVTTNAQGGGVYSSASTAVFKDTIIWNNSSSGDGEQIYHYSTSQNLSLRYCIFSDTPSDIYDNNGNIIKANPINLDPKFVTGNLGDYYLEHAGVATGTTDSPAKDAGSDSAVLRNMNFKTTRVDSVTDTSQVDLGYHYDN